MIHNNSKHIKIAAFFLTALLGVSLITTNTSASDHGDSPNTTQGNLDIADYYVFSHGNNVVFVMTVDPLLAPGQATTNARFNPDGLYQFKLDKNHDGVEDAVIQVTICGTGANQEIVLRGPSKPAVTGTNGNKILNDKDPIVALFNTVAHKDSISLFGGPTDDPFFIHLLGDSSLTSVLNAFDTKIYGHRIGDSTQQALAFSNPGVNNLAGENVLAIVIEMPKSMVAKALGISVNDKFYSWTTTSIKRQ